MRIKKLFAGILAGAMVVGCMVMPVSANYDVYDFNETGWSQDVFMTSTDTSIDLTSADSVIVHGYCTDTGGGYNNGQFYVSTPNGQWIQVGFCGSNCPGQSWYDVENYVVIDDVGAFDVEIEFDEDTSFSVGAGTGVDEGIFYVTSVDVYDGTTLLATWVDGEWTSATSTYDDVLTYSLSEEQLKKSSYTVTLMNSDGDTAEITDNTYVADGDSYYIEIDLSDIPDDQQVTIYSVTFN